MKNSSKIAILFGLLLLPFTSPSLGDRSKQFRTCAQRCFLKNQCSSRKPQFKSMLLTNETSNAIWNVPRELVNCADFFVNQLRWDCVSECNYECMVDYSSWRERNHKEVTKFFGKWPFKRVFIFGWGVQELFSSVFSALNGVPHLMYLLFYRHEYAPRGYFMRPWLILYSIVCINSWI